MNTNPYVDICPTIECLVNPTENFGFTVEAFDRSQREYEVFIRISPDITSILYKPIFEPANSTLNTKATVDAPAGVFQLKVGTTGKSNKPLLLDLKPFKENLKKVWKEFSENPRIYYTAFLFDPKTPKVEFPQMEVKNKEATLPFILGKGKEEDRNGNEYAISEYFNGPGIKSLPMIKVVGNALQVAGVDNGPREGQKRKNGERKELFLRGINLSGMQYVRFWFLEPGASTNQSYHFSRKYYWKDIDWWKYVMDKDGRNKVTWARAADILDMRPNGIQDKKLEELNKWGVNIIRLPLNQQQVLNGFDDRELQKLFKNNLKDFQKMLDEGISLHRTGLDYLKEIDTIVETAAKWKIRVILCMHTTQLIYDEDSAKAALSNNIDPVKVWVDNNRIIFQGFIPDNNTSLFWLILARRYKSCTHVLYDIYNEPHVLQPKDPKDASIRFEEYSQGIVYPPKSADWGKAWIDKARFIEKLIHDGDVNPDAILLMSGFDGDPWSAGFEKIPLKEGNSPLPNTIYSSHWYDHRFNKNGGKQKSEKPADSLNDLKQKLLIKDKDKTPPFPVIFGEWGIETKQACLLENIKSTTTSYARAKEFLTRWGSGEEPQKDSNGNVQVSTLSGKVPDDAYLISWFRDYFLPFTREFSGTMDGKKYNGIAGQLAWTESLNLAMYFYKQKRDSSNTDCTTLSELNKVGQPMGCPTDYGIEIIKEFLSIKEWEEREVSDK